MSTSRAAAAIAEAMGSAAVAGVGDAASSTAAAASPTADTLAGAFHRIIETASAVLAGKTGPTDTEATHRVLPSDPSAATAAAAAATSGGAGLDPGRGAAAEDGAKASRRVRTIERIADCCSPAACATFRAAVAVLATHRRFVYASFVVLTGFVNFPPRYMLSVLVRAGAEGSCAWILSLPPVVVSLSLPPRLIILVVRPGVPCLTEPNC